MALITFRGQCSAVRIWKDVFLTNEIHKHCGGHFINVERKRRSSNERIAKSEHDKLGRSAASASCRPLTSTPSECKKTQHITVKGRNIHLILQRKLKITEEFIYNEIMKHPKRNYIQVYEIFKTLKFLKNQGFTKKLISESPAICFYPRRNIVQGLQAIKNNKEELSKIGFLNGYLIKDPPTFSHGIDSQDKRLQLCLYYMEVPFGFNGCGIFPSA